MRSGLCSIVGRTNVGKSTLLNALVGAKVAIATPVPQTTRHALRGVLHRDDAQVVFVDTPGLHKPRTLLGSRLNDLARDQLGGVDVVVFVVDGAAGVGQGDRFIARLLGRGPPVLAVCNKIDRLGRARQLPQLERLAGLGDWDEIVPVSAATGDGVDLLAGLIVDRLPEGAAYYPAGQVSDQPRELLVAEVIREKAITRARQEVPHSIAVVVDEIAPGERDDVLVVSATIYVERDSQKGIVVGAGGASLRDVGAEARPELECALGSRVWLDLRVKLAKEWQGDPKKLQRLGY
ncbi:MAG: GTPase Era [Actinobacteria bacterium]|nr:GTPase Era [Actinomycetota bacterium]